MIERCFICWAILGRCSQIWTSPLVEIGLKGPPVAAPGLRSQRSMVEGPPPIQSMMALLRFALSVLALVRKVLPKASAGIAIELAPTMCETKCRRDIPAGVLNCSNMMRVLGLAFV